MRWPVIPLSLPNGSDEAVSVAYSGPFSRTPNGNAYTLLFIDRSNRLAVLYPVSGPDFTAEGTAKLLPNNYIPSQCGDLRYLSCRIIECDFAPKF